VKPDFSDLIASLFEAYAEKEDKSQKKRYPRNYNELKLSIVDAVRKYNKEPEVNLRTFLFNYKRYLKDKFKKKDLVSTKKARDLNSLLREYISEWKTHYPKFFLHKLSKTAEEEKRAALRDFLPIEIVLGTSRRDLETFNYDRVLEQYKSAELKLKEFNNCPFNTVKLQEKFVSICSNLPVKLSQIRLIYFGKRSS
jgi:hypothetical protein